MNELRINKNYSYDGISSYIIVDETTGVNYIACKYFSFSSNGGGGVTIVPRLNADGSLYVTK